MSALQAFHFLRPWWLLALLAWPLLPFVVLRGSGDAMLRRLVDARMLPFLVEGGGRHRIGVLVTIMAAWLLACVALAGPTWQQRAQPVYGSRSAQVIAVSMSRRMLAQDLSPSRLDRVRYKIHQLLQANRAGQNGLVAYAGAAFTVAPLTRDADALTELVDALAPDTMPVDGDDAAAAIRRAARLIRNDGMRQGSIVVIDDHADASALDAARAAHASGMRVSVLGVGTRKGAPVPSSQGGFESESGHTMMARRDDASLSALARAGGGRYAAMTPDDADVAAMASQLRARAGQRDSKDPQRTWLDRGPWLLLPLLLLMALGFRRGVLLMVPVLLLPLVAAPAHASGWKDAWRTRDQQAARALAQGHPDKAMQLAHDPALRGTAAYRAGHYKEAARAFAKAVGASNIYNRGNALARMQRYQDAIKAYDQALALDPGLADARANRKAIRDWLARHKPPRKEGGKGARDHGKEGGKDGSSSGKHGASSSSGGKNGSSSGNTAQGDKKGGKDASGKGDRKHTSGSHGASSGPSGQGDSQDQGKGVKAQTRAQEQAQARARQALKQQLDTQLGPSGTSQHPYVLGQRSSARKNNGKPLPAAMRQALEQVPDDPGGLLRNKFMLEYQQRQQGAGTSSSSGTNGGQP